MTEHMCRWSVLKPEPTEPGWYIWCALPEGCGKRMDTIEEIERRLNATQGIIEKCKDPAHRTRHTQGQMIAFLENILAELAVME